MELHYDTYMSPLGTLYVVFTSKGVIRLDLTQKKFDERCSHCTKGKNEVARRQLQEYFHGKRKKFSLPLHLNGTSFQKKVWRTIDKIPYGKTRSYQWVAREIGKPKASRAVGNALGANPIPIIIPCHRVIKKNGEIGGYSGGHGLKKKLLEHERNIKNSE